MSLISVVTFSFVPTSTDYMEIEKEEQEHIKKWKTKMCSNQNFSKKDMHWSTRIVSDAQDVTTITIVGFHVEGYKNETSDKLTEMLEDAKELEQELEEIEDLDGGDYDEYGFESEQEYKERLDEIENDIFVCESEIEMIEDLLKTK